MAAGPVQVAKRALVTLLIALAQQYGVRLALTREDSDALVNAAFRKVVKHVHPDKGGRLEDAQRLQAARDRWANAKSEHGKHKHEGRQGVLLPLRQSKEKKAYEIRAAAVLLTFHGIQESHWPRFLQFVKRKLSAWHAHHWCASMESCASGAPHCHLMLQFTSATHRQVDEFCFEKCRPNASTTDLCGEGLCRKQWQRSVDRGFFYVYADKIGTVQAVSGDMLTQGNYLPCWTSSERNYQVLGKWPETLWKQRKISTSVYEQYLYLSRDGVVSRHRNLTLCREQEQRLEAEAAVQERIKRIRGNPELFHPFPQIPSAQKWLQEFQKDALRYPILIVLGPSRKGKTEWAKSLFKQPLEVKIGSLTFFPDSLRAFKHGFHDGLVLDDVRDLQFVVDHQEKLQGKYDCLVEFGSTAGGTCAYHLDLFGVPVVATINLSTKNLQFLDSHDWLANPGNRVLVHFGCENEWALNSCAFAGQIQNLPRQLLMSLCGICKSRPLQKKRHAPQVALWKLVSSSSELALHMCGNMSYLAILRCRGSSVARNLVENSFCAFFPSCAFKQFLCLSRTKR